MLGVLKKPYVVASVVLLAVVGYVLVTNRSPILAGHPSYVVFYLASVVGAIVAVAAGAVHRNAAGRRWPAALAAVPLLLLAVGAWLVSPFAATDVAVDALSDSGSVVVSSSASAILLEPTTGAESVGLVFQPGARVDARAYARILRPIAAAGYPVAIVKPPLGIPFFASGFAAAWAASHPATDTWVVGGHSLGGVVASANAADETELDALVLWASFPAADISDSPRLVAVSIYGTNDGLSEVVKVLDSSRDLPPATAFVPIAGAIHSFFGDYGDQPGDGEPGVSRRQAQAEIIAATIRFLDGLGATQ